VIVEVIDDGPGIPEDRVDQIFRNNGAVTSSEVIGSMGLGLHVSRSLAQMMGSSLSYERRDGESRFRVDLPAAADS
jgi:signal transduction histidine kinase